MRTFAPKSSSNDTPTRSPFIQPNLEIDRVSRLTLNHPNDKYEQEADRIAGQVIHMPEPTHEQTSTMNSNIGAGIHSLKGGQPLPESTRTFFESRFAHDFSKVRVHTDPKAAAAASAVNAKAFTTGKDMVFGSGHYSPQTSAGKKLIAHELTHVVQQENTPRPSLQMFTAEQSGDKIYIKPEKGDTDADLDKILCAGIKDRRIAGRENIDVTDCFPRGTIKAMSLGAYNCADFVRKALGDIPPEKGAKPDRLLTPGLWDELLKKGFQIRSIGVVKPDGKVEAAEGLSWKQLSPRMGDLVFMKGNINLKKGEKEPNAAGDNFTVTWDHVGFFIVRSRDGFDYHLAKDGDENPIAVYHTGTELEEGLGDAPGAYVKEEGVASLLAYLGVPEPTQGLPKNPKGVPFYGEIIPWSAALRETPEKRKDNVIADLPRNHRVRVLGGEAWIQVETTLDEKELSGYVSHELIRRIDVSL